MRILHLVRKLNDPYPTGIIAAQRRDPNARVQVVYLQDAVYREAPEDVETFVLDEDCRARGVSTALPSLSYDELVERIFQSDRVISW